MNKMIGGHPWKISHGRQEEHEQGFALLVVIWAIGLIALIALVMITTSRSRLQATANLVDNARAENYADAGVGLARIALTRTFAGTDSGKALSLGERPFLCAFSSDAVAAISIEDEAGKVNLNLASASMLSALFRAFGASDAEAGLLGRNVVEFTRVAVSQDGIGRSESPQAGTSPPKHAPMTSPFELDQVAGMRRDLFEAVLPYVTVTSQRPGIDPRQASPVLLAGLSGASFSTIEGMLREAQATAQSAGPSGGGGDLPAEWNSPSLRSSFRIVADVMTTGGSFFSREVNVEWLGSDQELRTQEWRRGRGRLRLALDRLKSERLNGTGLLLPSCQ